MNVQTHPVNKYVKIRLDHSSAPVGVDMQWQMKAVLVSGYVTTNENYIGICNDQ